MGRTLYPLSDEATESAPEASPETIQASSRQRSADRIATARQAFAEMMGHHKAEHDARPPTPRLPAVQRGKWTKEAHRATMLAALRKARSESGD